MIVITLKKGWLSISRKQTSTITNNCKFEDIFKINNYKLHRIKRWAEKKIECSAFSFLNYIITLRKKRLHTLRNSWFCTASTTCHTQYLKRKKCNHFLHLKSKTNTEKCSRYGFFSGATKRMPNNRGQTSTKRKEWTEEEEEEKNEHTSKTQPKLPRLCIATEFCKTMQNAQSASYIKKNNNVYCFHFLVHLWSNSLFVYTVLILAMCK